MYQLRDYQTEMVASIIKGFKTLNDPFVAVAATAAGKSLVIADVCHKIDEPVLILQPSKEILEQNYAKLKSYGIEDIGLYSASVGSKEIAKYTFATIQSIYKHPELFKHFKYAIIDECHQVGPKNINGMYMTFFRAIGLKNICGLTATPFRLENMYFADRYAGSTKMLNRITRKPFFKSIVYKVEMADLIERGYLTQPIYHDYGQDMSLLRANTTGANYDEHSVQLWANEKIGKIGIVAKDLDAKHQRVLVFCATLEQAGKAVQLLAMDGIHAEVLDGKTPKKKREDFIERFQDGRLKWAINVGTMTTGFDCPPLDAVVMFRPTMSIALYVQMLGRCVRLDPANPNKEAHFYDFTSTHIKFGRAETIRVSKENGFKDILVSEVGRLDNIELFSFDRKVVKKKEGPKISVRLSSLLSKV